MDQWMPAAEGTAFEFTRTLKPLEPFRNQLIVLSGLDNHGAIVRTGASGAHAQPAGAFMTGAEPYRTDSSSSLQLGVSMDQIAAKALGRQTPLPSLELGLEGSDIANGSGTCDVGFACAYQNTLSWSSPTTPMPPEQNPRVVFERLFGGLESTDPIVRTARLRRQASILDRSQTKSSPSAKRWAARSGQAGRCVESVREIERRIRTPKPWAATPAGRRVAGRHSSQLKACRN